MNEGHLTDPLVTRATRFARHGPENTEAVVEAALTRAGELGLKDIVVASCTGTTARAAYLPQP